jgi:hypothetical protein
VVADPNVVVVLLILQVELHVVLVFHVPPKRVIARTRHTTNFADVCLNLFSLLVYRLSVTLGIAYAGERLLTRPAFPAFLPFPLQVLLLPRSRSSTCGWRGAFNLHLVDSHRETHFAGILRAPPPPICSTPFPRCFTE